MKRLRHALLAFISLFIVSLVRADEGMWLPLLLDKLNEKQMKSLGMKISASDIYNINKGSLKDAIVSFGGFCTGEVVSDQGLVLTNHHCGFDAIQNHSTIEHNYIREGFWSNSNAEELTNPGLFVTFIVRIEDVSKPALAGVNAEMSEAQRQSQIDKNINELKKNTKKENGQDVFVRGFFEGNQYYLFVTETYRDIRLVGAPPSSIGNFGKDTDNWIWPRHTGDFSIFRIYAGKDNKPADYSPDNVPYKPKKSLSISLSGMKEGDFTMVFGFPGRTTEYLHSAAVDQVMHVNDPAKIAIRGKILGVMDNYMRKNEQIKIQYAAKYASIENGYKKWQGEVLGLNISDGLGKKKAYEKEFQKRVDANPALKSQYGNLLNELAAAYAEIKDYGFARDYYLESISRMETVAIAGWINTLADTYTKEGEKSFQTKLAATRKALSALFDEYNADLDRTLFEGVMKLYLTNQQPEFLPPLLKQMYADAGQDISVFTQNVFSHTYLFRVDSVMQLLNKPAADIVAYAQQDPVVKIYRDMVATYSNLVLPKLNEIQPRINRLQRLYMQAQMDVFKEKTFFPDANSTLRVGYGQVKGYQARDAVRYNNYTYLDGVMEKYKPGDYEFDVPSRLQELWRKKDYGPYGSNGRMPVCFIATNHTTGGNSGSPVLDARGNLVGLNFDRVWEGTMSDINYDPAICRNIMVDLRYVLFIIDKYAGATRLIKEMKLVGGKK